MNEKASKHRPINNKTHQHKTDPSNTFKQLLHPLNQRLAFSKLNRRRTFRNSAKAPTTGWMDEVIFRRRDHPTESPELITVK